MDERLLDAQEELLKQYDSLYEAIMVLSQRARQIGNAQLSAITQLQKMHANLEVARDTTIDDDFDLSEPRDPIELPKFPKPTIAAIYEALEHRIEWHYDESAMVEPPEDLTGIPVALRRASAAPAE